MWLTFDRSYELALPAAAYTWIRDAFGVVGCGAPYDVDVWTTAAASTLVLHVLASSALHVVTMASTRFRRGGAVLRRRVFPVVGWISWLLVVTLSVTLVADWAREMQIGAPSTLSSGEVATFWASSFGAVCLIHLIAMPVFRRCSRS